jgi:hypothetical protein
MHVHSTVVVNMMITFDSLFLQFRDNVFLPKIGKDPQFLLQDYKEKMLAHRDNRLYAEWDLESSAAIISNRFPSSHVWTVKAAQMIVGTFNIFSNFVKWTDVPSGGIGPVHQPGQRSWHHLRSLLQNAVMRMNAACDQAINRHSVPNAACYGETFNANLPTVLVGFSKGCVVLNQLAYDLASLSGDEDTDVENFVNLVESVYWLDGGHGGGAETWVTRDDVLAYLTRFEIHARVTPYQVNDFLRPWIGREHEAFVAGLQRHKAKVDDILLFGDQPRSLENHFRILRLF